MARKFDPLKNVGTLVKLKGGGTVMGYIYPFEYSFGWSKTAQINTGTVGIVIRRDPRGLVEEKQLTEFDYYKSTKYYKRRYIIHILSQRKFYSIDRNSFDIISETSNGT